MIILLKIEEGKDATKQKKRVLWTTIKTDIETIGTFTSVSEIVEDSVLWKELDMIVQNMLAMKNEEMKVKKELLKNKK